MKTVDVYLHDKGPEAKPHVIKGGALLWFATDDGSGGGLAGVQFTTIAVGWISLAMRHGEYGARVVEEVTGEIIVHVEVFAGAHPAVESIKSSGADVAGVAVTLPGISWFPADVGEA